MFSIPILARIEVAAAKKKRTAARYTTHILFSLRLCHFAAAPVLNLNLFPLPAQISLYRARRRFPGNAPLFSGSSV
jgi:hypothetical protein